MNKCHQCQSLEIIKQGFHGNKQRYKCRGCGYQSTQTNTPMSEAEREKRMLRGLCLFLIGPYQKLIPESMLIQSKIETVAIEQNNPRQRHWLAAFRRLSIVVSKSLKVLESTLALFAFHRVNNNFADLLNCLGKIS